MKTLKIVLFVVLFIIAIGAIVPAFLPASIHVERRITIDRPRAEVYAVLTDFHQGRHWDPWVQRDPDIKTTVTGEGKDARYAWDGPVVGAGELWFTEMIEPSELKVAITMTEPMEDRFSAGWKLQELRMLNAPPRGGPQPPASKLGPRTVATWYMDSELGYFERYFGSMISDLVGADYEQGLLNLKEYVEGKAAEEAGAQAPLRGGR